MQENEVKPDRALGLKVSLNEGGVSSGRRTQREAGPFGADLGLCLTASGTPVLVGVPAVGARGDLGVPGVLGVGVVGVGGRLTDGTAPPSGRTTWPGSLAPGTLPPPSLLLDFCRIHVEGVEGHQHHD